MSRRLHLSQYDRKIMGIVALCLFLPVAAAGGGAVAKPRRPDPNAAESLPKPEPQFPLGAAWVLVQINGKPVGGDQPSFSLDDKFRATGFAGCNTYSLPLYPSRGQKLLAGGIARTSKICDKSLLVLEQTFLLALHSVPVWHLENSDLIIKTPVTTLRFQHGI